MLDGRGKALVSIGAFILLFGFVIVSYFLITLGCFFILGAVISLPFFDFNIDIDALVVTRTMDKTKVFQDDFIHVVVEIKNKGSKRFDFVEIKDLFPEEYFICAIGEPFISTRIDAKKAVRFSYVLKPKVRGEYFLGPIEIAVKDRLEFNNEKREIPDSYTRLIVYPPYGDLRKIDALRGRSLGKMFGVHRSVQVGTGSDFHGIREYQFGDEFRKINWRATAKHSRIMVKEMEQEKNINVLVAIDSSSTMGAGTLLNTKLEFSIRAAIVVCKVALEHKDLVGGAVFQNNPKKKDLNKGVRVLESEAGDQQLFQMLDFISTAHPVGPKTLGLWMDMLVKQLRKRHLIILISDLEAPIEEIKTMFTKVRARGHELIVISPFSPWFEVFGRELTPAERALAEAISEEMMQHVLEAKQIAQPFGIPVINAGPDDIIQNTIEEYLHAKAKGKAQI
ncbi:MAG TPA: DUF58 domain-containing protein [Candidatus Lokiarchaeia archaeon]|nr:DUF58 domain-containing protein [Candidatus Lokiarchaeia archaeon]